MSEPFPPPMPPPPSQGDVRTWCMACHLSALAGLIIPFGSLLGPLLVWQIKKNQIPAVELHGKASLNFQLTVAILTVIAGLLAFALSFVCIGFILIPVVAVLPIAGMVLAVIAGIKANNGEDYRYPYVWELIK
ncbi:MAG: DUF4870 domain-containing protein [Verrucomicrobia bacterium]|nr:DUF4870 domain-containing protein [Verrucomicrobiota bacterium]